MPKIRKFVTFSFTPHQLEMGREILEGAIAHMSEKRAAATDPKEIEFYTSRPAHFVELLTLLAKGGVPAKDKARKIRLSSEQYHMLHSSLSHRNLQTTLFLHDLPDGEAKDAGARALEDWSDFCDRLGLKDPRQFDTSQDAEPEEDEDGAEADGED